VPDLRNPRDPLKPFEQEASIAFFPTKFLSTKTKGKEPYLNELLLKICAIAGCKETDGPLKECVKNFTEASTKQLQCIVLYKQLHVSKFARWKLARKPLKSDALHSPRAKYRLPLLRLPLQLP
jgi:hypothetical protein